MLSTHCETPGRLEWLLKSSATMAVLILMVIVITISARAQTTFNSGSTGADGAFSPTVSQEVQLPESGVFNFTTVNIPPGVTITFRRNSRNTPVTILTTGAVTIRGTFDVSGGDNARSVFDSGRGSGRGKGGPGGFDGGAGGASFAPFFFTNTAGDGPGGGASITFGAGGGFGQPAVDCNDSKGGLRYGSRTLVPLIGGSGGGGIRGFEGDAGFGGAGGGGAILIASSSTITFGPDGGNRGSIFARGGQANMGGGSGGGAGGGIRLVANTTTGHANQDVRGGSGGCPAGGHGYIRIEAFSFTGFQPNPMPATTFDGQPMISLAQPNPVTLANAPQLRIASIAGIAAPAAPAGSFSSPPDLIVSTTLANPVDVAIEAANIPVGTVVQVLVSPDVGTRQNVQSSPLSGTAAASTATASVSLPNSGMSVITATVSFTPPATAANRMIDGERVDRIEVAASYGGASKLTYITQSGRRVASIQ